MSSDDLEQDDEIFFLVSEGVAMFNDACTAVLMVQHEDTFDLPRFHYDVKNTIGKRIDLLIDDLQQWFGVGIDAGNGDVRFSAMTRLFDVCVPSGRILEVQVMECHPRRRFDDLPLPTGATWMTAEQIADIDETAGNPDGIASIKRNLLNCLHSCTGNEMSYFTTIADVRYRFGWYEQASKYLASLIERENVAVEGHMVQHQVTHTSTILKINSSDGWYFLKAPALGFKEVQITQAVTRMFPDRSPTLLDVNDSLNCFVTKGFQHVPPNEEEDLRVIVGNIANFHAKSQNRVSELAAAGCPVRDIKQLVAELESWSDDPEFGRSVSCSKLPEVLPKVKRMIELLQNYNLPTTLVHGDIGARNMSSKNPNGVELLFFDWAFAYIGVPFLEFFEMGEHMTDDMLEEYLSIWTCFESMDRLKEAFKLAFFLGYFMRCWALVDAFRACGQDECSLGGWCLTAIEWANYRIIVYEDKGLLDLS